MDFLIAFGWLIVGCLALLVIVALFFGVIVLSALREEAKATRQLREWRSDEIERRLKQLRGGDADERVNAARALQDFEEEPRVIDALEVARNDLENEVRWSASGSLEVLRSPISISQRGFLRCRRCNMFMKHGHPDSHGVLMTAEAQTLSFCPQCGLIVSNRTKEVIVSSKQVRRWTTPGLDYD